MPGLPPGPPLGSSLPPPPVGPSEPAFPAEPRGPHLRRWLIPVLVGVGVLAVVVVALVLSNRRHSELPDQVADLHRLHTSEVRALEEQTNLLKLGDIKIEIAGYGSDEEVELILLRYSNLPAQPPVGRMLRGAGGGLEGAGGTVDFDAMTSRLRDGVEYTCLPFTGRLFPADPAETSGQMCAWAEGSDVAVVMDARTSDVDAAVADSAAMHAALAESG